MIAFLQILAILWTPYALAGAWFLFQHMKERGAK